MDNIILVVALAAGSGIAAFLIGWFLSRSITKERIAASQQEAERIVADAQKEAETMYKEKMLELRDEQLRQRTALENEIREIRDELARHERSLKDKDANLRNVRDETERKRKEVDRLLGQNAQKEKKVAELEIQLEETLKHAQAELERAAGLSKDDALEQLKESLLSEARAATADLNFTNAGSTDCTLHGFPGVSFVGMDNGTQIGAPAVREGDAFPAVTLGPGENTIAALKISRAENYDSDACSLQPVDGLRVYPPGETASAYLPLEGFNGCDNDGLKLLTIKSVGA